MVIDAVYYTHMVNGQTNTDQCPRVQLVTIWQPEHNVNLVIETK